MANPASMSYAPPGAPGVVARPATAAVAFFGALAAGLFTVIGSVLLIAQAKDVAAQSVKDLGADPTGLFQSVVDDAADKLHSRGILGLAFGILVVAAAVLARNAATWARVVLSVVLVVEIFIGAVTARDIAPGGTKVLDGLAIVLALVAIVAAFMPATGRFAKARKLGTPA
ncbi:MAG TPA: hypothetical protein VKB69_09640 [Micromonosporaceae bacterium]|nr:hypothetical protein [Micromonosporaceae bacterium]